MKRGKKHQHTVSSGSYIAELFQRVTLISFRYEDNEEGQALQLLAENFLPIIKNSDQANKLMSFQLKHGKKNL